MFEIMWHILVNVTISWGICAGVHMYFVYKHRFSYLIQKWKRVFLSENIGRLFHVQFRYWYFLSKCSLHGLRANCTEHFNNIT
jgi:hypothetical protein